MLKLYKLDKKDQYDCVIKLESELTTYIKDTIHDLYGSVAELVTSSVKTELLEHIIKVEILKVIVADDVKLESDIPYIFTISYLGTAYRFVVAYISKEDLGKGYTIAKTLKV